MKPHASMAYARQLAWASSETRNSRPRTHGAAEHRHEVKKRIKGIAVVLDIRQHDLGQPLALQPLRQRQERRSGKPAHIKRSCRFELELALEARGRQSAFTPGQAKHVHLVWNSGLRQRCKAMSKRDLGSQPGSSLAML